MGKVCAFSGHRELLKDFSFEELKSNILEVISEGYTTFLTGMAVGFDTVAAEIVLELKREHSLTLKAYIPCPEQSRNFTSEEKERYDKILASADEKQIISEHYTPWCMQKRNRKLVEDSDLLLCYLRKKTGGTRFTFNYALECGKRVINI